MKGIETGLVLLGHGGCSGSDHCPAMKGIETGGRISMGIPAAFGSDHCPAMKGIETRHQMDILRCQLIEATTAPQ